MIIVQYPMQFSEPPRNIRNHVQQRFMLTDGGDSTNATWDAFHAL